MDYHNANEFLAERYVLDEMTDDEREEYEGHFFDCLPCSNAVREVASFMEAGRHLVRQTDADVQPTKEVPPANVAPPNNVVPLPVVRPAKWRWLPAAAAAALLVASLGVQGIPGFHKEPPRRITASRSVLLNATRAGAVKSIPAAVPTTLIVVVTEADKTRFWCEVRDARDAVHFEDEVLVDPNEGTLAVDLDANVLRPGEYTLGVAGIGADGQRSGFEKLRFDVEGP